MVRHPAPLSLDNQITNPHSNVLPATSITKDPGTSQAELTSEFLGLPEAGGRRVQG